MTEVLAYDIITDLNTLGYGDVNIDSEILDIDWIDDLQPVEDDDDYE